MFFQQTIDHKLEQWIQDIRESTSLPVRLRLWNDNQYELGRFEQPRVTLTVREAGALPLLLSPTLNNLGEAYVQEKIDLNDKPVDIINVSYSLAATATVSSGNALARVVRHFTHTKEGDKESIQYHYDVSSDFYKLWLDGNVVYSCTYFESGDETLNEARLKKVDHILTKIRLQPGQTLLDIGYGRGALVPRAAQRHGACRLSVTLPQNQYDLAVERVRVTGLQDQIEIRIQDYHGLTGQFDHIASVGMFEHVDRKDLPGYFRRMHDLLADNGIIMNHGIALSDSAGGESSTGGDDFIDRYVFPQGELPHISLALSAAQDGGLEALDIENPYRHCAHMLGHWTGRFETNSETIRVMMGEREYRIWRVYLVSCARAFDADEISIFQTVLQETGKSAMTIPWSRRYIYA